MILYLIYGFGMVTCTVSPLSRFTARLRIFHVCRNENFRNGYLSFYWKKDFIFDMWLWHGDLYRVSPFQIYCTSTSCLPCDLEFFMFAIMKIFVTDISASTWLDHEIWRRRFFRPEQIFYVLVTAPLPFFLLAHLTLWVRSAIVTTERPSVNFSHFNQLLWSHWANLNQTLVEWPPSKIVSGDPDFQPRWSPS
jgi:hypothetical protein